VPGEVRVSLSRSRRYCSEQLTAPSPVTAAFGATTGAAVGIIIELNRQLTELEAATS
jgi:hypothetical protein